MPDFKVGDKVVFKLGQAERTVLAVFNHPETRAEWISTIHNNDTGDHIGSYPANGFKLVPDPMVARREAYIEWCKLAWPNGDNYYAEHFDSARNGSHDAVVNNYYDAIVATKHLFT